MIRTLLLLLLVSPLSAWAQVGPYDDPPGQWLVMPNAKHNAWQSITTFPIQVTGPACDYVGIGLGPEVLVPLPDVPACVPEVQALTHVYNALDALASVTLYDYQPGLHYVILKVCDGLVGRTHGHVVKLVALVGCHT